MRPLTCLAWCMLLLSCAAIAQTAQSPIAAMELQDGDSFVFVGDSITHGGSYTQYVEDFYFTRYPERRIRFHNAGISGDKAQDALDRFDLDIVAYKPQYATVLLGMNDGAYSHFDHDIFATYERDMGILLDQLEALGAKILVMAPTQFDHVNNAARMNDEKYRGRARQRSPYYNAVLAFYGAWLREQVFQRGLGFADLWTPLNDLTLEQRKTNPAFTFIPDSIHPQQKGHAIMAAALIRGLNPKRAGVSAIALSRNGRTWTSAESGGAVSNLKGKRNGLTFTFSARSLPWVLPPEAQLGYDLANAGPTLSKETLHVAGLPPGDYEIDIDGQNIGGPYSHTALAAGLELQSNPLTPQYQQALEAALLNQERHAKTIRPIRGLRAKYKSVHRQRPFDAKKLDAAMAINEPKIKELEAQAAGYEDKIHALVQPIAKAYEIKRVSSRQK